MSPMPLLDYIDALIPEDGHLVFDFNDPKQYEFATANTRRYFDTERYPGLLATLERCKDHQEAHGFTTATDTSTEDGFTTKFMVTGAGRVSTQSQGVAARGLGTVAGGYASLGLLLFIKDNTSGDIITHGSGYDLAGVYQPINTPPSSGDQSLDLTSYLHYTYTPADGQGQPVSGMVKQAAYGTTGDPVLSQPVHTCTDPWVSGAINIGLGRQWTDSQLGSKFDYVWAEDNNNDPIGKIPFVGWVEFTQTIQALTPNQNFLLSIDVADATSGGVRSLQPADLSSVYEAFTIDSDYPSKLNWCLPAGSSVSDPGNPIVFSEIPWPADMKAQFYCQILVTLADGSFGSASVLSQDTPDSDPLDGNLGILPIAFVWHCLAEDTLVTMADGSRKPIGDVVAGERILDGGDATVVAFTTRGVHRGRAVRIVVNDGRSVVSSTHHVFETDRGLAPAAELRTGDRVAMSDGWAVIEALERLEDIEGMFCNLALADEQDHLDEQARARFLANDFKVGDLVTQRHYRDVRRNDKEWVKKQVPEYLHRDVDAFFEDKGRRPR